MFSRFVAILFWANRQSEASGSREKLVTLSSCIKAENLDWIKVWVDACETGEIQFYSTIRYKIKGITGNSLV